MKTTSFSLAKQCRILAHTGKTMHCKTIGTSMFPLIRSGCLIEIMPICIDKIKKNSVIAFQAGNYIVAHRVKKISTKNGKKIFYVKGDSHFGFAKQIVNAKQVIGEVASIQTSKGKKINIRHQPAKLASILLGYLSPFFLYAYLVFTRFVKKPT